MPHHTDKIGALIGSRICHDLISPIGAISNGLELLAMAGNASGPEMDLLKDSAIGAATKIKQFRLAFGQATEQEIVGKSEFSNLLSELYAKGRITLNHAQTSDISRAHAKAVMLSVMCAEQTLPFGGQLTVTVTPDHREVTAESPRLGADPMLWQFLQIPNQPYDAGPDQIQFLLLMRHMAEMNLSLRAELMETKAKISF